MLSGTRIDHIVVGGPAFRSGKLDNGDSILRVDGVDATTDTIHDLLIGTDIPDSTVLVSIQKNDFQVKNLALYTAAKLLSFPAFTGRNHLHIS